jgi:hypothetical protein
MRMYMAPRVASPYSSLVGARNQCAYSSAPLTAHCASSRIAWSLSFDSLGRESGSALCSDCTIAAIGLQILGRHNTRHTMIVVHTIGAPSPCFSRVFLVNPAALGGHPPPAVTHQLCNVPHPMYIEILHLPIGVTLGTVVRWKLSEHRCLIITERRMHRAFRPAAATGRLDCVACQASRSPLEAVVEVWKSGWIGIALPHLVIRVPVPRPQWCILTATVSQTRRQFRSGSY